jgi:hypothetical protein
MDLTLCYDACTMPGPRFILREATVTIGFDEAGKRIAVSIPAGAEITVNDIVPLDPTVDETEQVNISWEGRSLSMFLTDLQNRGDRVRPSIRSESQASRTSS